MGLLDSLAGQVIGSLAGGGNAQGGGGLAQIAVDLIANSQGGLGGLLSQFSKAGLGAQADSWVGTGDNLPISADQLQSVLGSDLIAGLAQKVGASPDMVSSGLSSLLPQLVDQLTPNGRVEEQSGGLLEQGIAALAGKLLGGR